MNTPCGARPDHGRIRFHGEVTRRSLETTSKPALHQRAAWRNERDYLCLASGRRGERRSWADMPSGHPMWMSSRGRIDDAVASASQGSDRQVDQLLYILPCYGPVRAIWRR